MKQDNEKLTAQPEDCDLYGTSAEALSKRMKVSWLWLFTQ